jgi:hypothetical protein
MRYGATMTQPRYTFDPREVDSYVSKLDPHQKLVYRLAIRGLCDRCRGDRAFKVRTEQLVPQRSRHHLGRGQQGRAT